MDCYILPDRYGSQLGLSIMRHSKDKVGVSRAVLNVPVHDVAVTITERHTGEIEHLPVVHVRIVGAENQAG